MKPDRSTRLPALKFWNKVPVANGSPRHPSRMATTKKRGIGDADTAVECRAVSVERRPVHHGVAGRQCQLVCPPPPCPRQTTCPMRTLFGPRLCPLGHRVGGWVIHFPAVVCMRLAQHS